MTLTKTELAARLADINITECGFCHRPISDEEVLTAGEAHDGSATVTGYCCLGQLTTIWAHDLPEKPSAVLTQAFVTAYQSRKAGLKLGHTSVHGPLIQSAVYLNTPQRIERLPGQYLDHEVIERAIRPPRDQWPPQLHEIAHRAESEDKQCSLITWPDGVQTFLSTVAPPRDELIIHAYRQSAAALMAVITGGAA